MSVAHLWGAVARSGTAERKELRRAVCARHVQSVKYGSDSAHTHTHTLLTRVAELDAHNYAF